MESSYADPNIDEIMLNQRVFSRRKSGRKSVALPREARYQSLKFVTFQITKPVH